MNERQMKAINNLYAATMEIMEAFAPETVIADQRREALSRIIENFLITASSPNEGIVYQEIPHISTPSALQPEVVPEPMTPAQDIQTSVPELETRFAVQPLRIDDDWQFKRPKAKKDCDKSTVYPYILQLGENEGIFSIECLISQINKDALPEMVVETVSGEAAIATKIVTVRPGKLVKDGKVAWKITQRVGIAYE